MSSTAAEITRVQPPQSRLYTDMLLADYDNEKVCVFGTICYTHTEKETADYADPPKIRYGVVKREKHLG